MFVGGLFVSVENILTEYRNKEVAKKIIKRIHETAHELYQKGIDTVKIMHVCGTHEDTLSKWAIRTVLPNGENQTARIKMVAGPGCPVCITPVEDIEFAVNLSNAGLSILSYGDMIRVPGARSSLFESKIKGADVRIVYSLHDAIKYAIENPTKKVCFLSPGFETTAPAPAVEILNGLPKNMYILSSHRLVPPALEVLTTHPALNIDAFILPGHVSTIIGVKAYRAYFEKYKMPCTITGFEPVDMLMGILSLLEQIRDDKPKLENRYPRVVTEEGNVIAQQKINQVFKVTDGNWRGIGNIPQSALELRDEFDDINVKVIYEDLFPQDEDLREIPKGCRCDQIIIGAIEPNECPLFLKQCTPETPIGPCMVGLEGTCRIQADFSVSM